MTKIYDDSHRVLIERRLELLEELRQLQNAKDNYQTRSKIEMLNSSIASCESILRYYEKLQSR